MKTSMMSIESLEVFLLPNVHGYTRIIERIGIISKIIPRLYSDPMNAKNSI